MDTAGLFRVDGMVAVITGGGTGIGLMMAKGLANAGAAKVYILGRRREVLEAAATAHPALQAVECDVTSKESLQAAVDLVSTETGFVNLVVANSGVLGDSQSRWDPDAPIRDLRRALFEQPTMEEFTRTFHVNVTGAFFTMTAFLELLDAGNARALAGGFGAPLRPGGPSPSIQSQVLITASIAAFSRYKGTNPAYGGSKAAIMHLTKQASTGLAAHGIRVNALAPGLFPSELASPLIGDRNLEEESHDHPGFIPAKRFGGDEEMAGTVLYLASRAGAFNNGLILVGDGGRLAVMPSTY